MFRKLLLLGLASLSICAQSQPISVRADQWMPVNGIPGASAEEGLYIDILRAVAKTSGVQIDYQLQGWDDSVKSAQTGQIDCVVGATREDAPGLRLAAKPWLVGNTAWYRAADRTEVSAPTVADLASFKLGVISGYGYGDEVDALVKAHPSERLEAVTSSRDPLSAVIMRLVTGRVDLALETDFVMQAKLRKLQLSDRVVQAGRSEAAKNIYLACNNDPRVSSFMQAVDTWYAARLAEGTLADYYAPYGLEVPGEAEGQLRDRLAGNGDGKDSDQARLKRQDESGGT